MRLIVVLVFIFLAAPGLAIAETTNFACSFDRMATPGGIEKELFNLNFILDNSSHKAYVIGNNGSSEVEVVKNLEGGLSFIERTTSGNIMVTAIHFKTGEAVHSRNSVFIDKIVPSQYYGNCLIK
jgi:hypothetical protein